MKYEFSDDEKEAFFEQNFDYDAESQENYEKAKNVFEESLSETTVIVEHLADGEVIDEPTLVLQLSKLLLARNYMDEFKK